MYKLYTVPPKSGHLHSHCERAHQASNGKYRHSDWINKREGLFIHSWPIPPHNGLVIKVLYVLCEEQMDITSHA